MAMLAEPRRRKRTLNLRGKNEWSDDQNKFGQKMLEKMGWAPGKGLGLNLNGSTDHVKVRFKDDNGGVGFKDRNDQWTEHEDNFNGLLKSLHGGAIDTTKLHSDLSLEEKSKKSQSRVHYKKFTRGKDITRYSAKDLANIFGKKSLDPKEKVKEYDVEPVNASVDDNVEEKSSEYNLIAAGSMKDYFKSKLGNKFDKKPLRNLGCKEIIDDPVVTNYEPDSDIVFRGFSGTQNHCDAPESETPATKNKNSFNFYQSKPHFELNDDEKESKPFSFYPMKSANLVTATTDVGDGESSMNGNLNVKFNQQSSSKNENVKCSKSKKKNKGNNKSDLECSKREEHGTVMKVTETYVKTKKSKSNITLAEDESNSTVNDNVEVIAVEESVTVANKNISKKKKNKPELPKEITDPADMVGGDMGIIVKGNIKKNNRKNSAVRGADNLENNVEILDDGTPRKNKKRKKSVELNGNSGCVKVPDENTTNGDERSMKCKKRKKNVEFSLEDNKTYVLEQEDDSKKPKKKKKNVLGCL